MPTEGVKLSGAFYKRGLRMDVALENLTKVSTEGARQFILLNLSGKRTEKVHASI